jgi:hypothetical protein
MNTPWINPNSAQHKKFHPYANTRTDQVIYFYILH